MTLVAALLILTTICLTTSFAHAAGDPVRERTVTVADASVFVREAGPGGGFPVLLLHGSAFHSGTWHELGTLTYLAELGYRVCAVDLPAYGKSSATSQTHLPFMRALFSALALDRPAVVCPSMSGRFAFPVALEASKKLRAFVPVAPAAISTYRNRLKNIAVPTLIVWGTKDAVFPVSDADLLDREIPNSRVLLIEGAPHPCYLGNAEVFHQGLAAFLEEVKGAGK
jgi:abhydrolase domain-containing protein 14